MSSIIWVNSAQYELTSPILYMEEYIPFSLILSEPFSRILELLYKYMCMLPILFADANSLQTIHIPLHRKNKCSDWDHTVFEMRLVLFRLYWHKLKTLNYITNSIMFSHNCVVTRNYITVINNFMLTGLSDESRRTKHVCNLRWTIILSKLEKISKKKWVLLFIYWHCNITANYKENSML